MSSVLLTIAILLTTFSPTLCSGTEDREYPNGVYMPTYLVWIIGILMLIMFLIIVGLVLIIWRTRMTKYKNFTVPDTPIHNLPDLNRSYMTQTSQEMKILKINSLSDNALQDTFHESVSSNSISAMAPSFNNKEELKRNTVDKNSGLGKDFKVYRSVKKPNQKMILKDQMKKICEDALAKSQNNGMTASLKDLHELLQRNDDRKSGDPENKSASHPELDIYDDPPSNIPVSARSDNNVYDRLPTSKNIIIEDYDTNYLLALSGENLSEPAYINAQCRYTKF